MPFNADDLIGPIRNRIQLARHKWLDNFVFIHISKTGGTSLTKVLKILMSYSTALGENGEIGRSEWDSRFTFSVIRNLWDKAVSHYHLRVQTDQTDFGDRSVGF